MGEEQFLKFFDEDHIGGYQELRELEKSGNLIQFLNN